MAPEVIGGGSGGGAAAVTLRADVYGLAASVYAMASREPPWGAGDPIRVLSRQLAGPPPPLSTLRPELAPIDDVLAGALSPEPERRPASAGSLSRALSRALGTILPSRGTRTLALPRTRTEQAALGARSRGVVFRAVARALGVQDADRLRDALGREHAELAQVLAQTAPTSWEPTALLVQLLELAPAHVGRDTNQFARDIARATVRASFRSFFPTSTATLHPNRTLAAIRGIWLRYHTWATVSQAPVRAGETVVRFSETVKVPALCEWTCELLDTLVGLSGGRDARTVHEACEVTGADACVFRVTWSEA